MHAHAEPLQRLESRPAEPECARHPSLDIAVLGGGVHVEKSRKPEVEKKRGDTRVEYGEEEVDLFLDLRVFRPQEHVGAERGVHRRSGLRVARRVAGYACGGGRYDQVFFFAEEPELAECFGRDLRADEPGGEEGGDEQGRRAEYRLAEKPPPGRRCLPGWRA